MTLSEFRARYPEFTSALDPFVTVFLNDAGTRLDAEVWGDFYDKGQGLLAAHLLCTAPNGQFSRLVTDKKRTTYLDEFDRLKNIVTVGMRVF